MMSLKHVMAAAAVVLTVGTAGAQAAVDNAREAQRAYEASAREYNEVAHEAERYENAARAIRDTAVKVEQQLYEAR